ncbi:MAG TPA: cytochrome c3 family protein [Acidobacteriota bacterium]
MRRRAVWAGSIAALAAACAAPQPAPEQPIAFSHKLHAGDYRIACEYCHSGARRSAVAGVPSLERCLGCHRIVAYDRPEIGKLAAQVERREPLAWVKVTDVPDFVRFNHRPHVRAGVACQACHGPVETMERVSRFSSLEMGWCLDCHRERGASVDCLVCHH